MDACREAWAACWDDYAFLVEVRVRAYADGVPFRPRLWLDDAAELAEAAGMAAKAMAATCTPDQLETGGVLESLTLALRHGTGADGEQILEYNPVTLAPVAAVPYVFGNPDE